MMIEQLKIVKLSKQVLDYIAVIKTRSAGNRVQYILGVQYQEQYLAIRSRHCENGSEVTEIYLMKQICEDPQDQLPEEYQIQLKDYKPHLFMKGDQIGCNNIFTTLELKEERESDFPILIPNKKFKFDNFSGAVVIGISQEYNRIVLKSFHITPAQIKTLQLRIESGLIFLFRTYKGKQRQYFYGFYDKFQGSETKYHDYHLYQESVIAQAQNQCYIQGHKVVQQPYPELRYPYNSIGMVVAPDGTYGTASLLYDNKQKQSKFLLTCAHNFLAVNGNRIKDNTHCDTLSQYKFFLPSRNLDEQPDRQVVKEVRQFRISRIYIPTEYYECIFSRDSQLQVEFPSTSHEQQRTLWTKQETLYDICIIELEEPLSIRHGFRLRKQENQFREIQKSVIELAGYPRAEEQVKTRFFHLYRQSTQGHSSGYVQLSNEVQGTGCRLIKHKLSTLAGNSGSPIYEKIGKQCYLFGVHTTGFGGKVFGEYNLGAYIYGKDIYSWLLNIPAIDTVFDY